MSFALPDGWHLVSPDAHGQPDAAYVAVRSTEIRQPVASNIIISGFAAATDHVDAEAFGSTYVANLQARHEVKVLKNDTMGSGPTQEAAQLLEITYPVAGTATPLTLKQVLITSTFPDTNDPESTAVLQLLLTCPADEFAHIGPEFQQFVTTIAPTPSTKPSRTQ
ncbi:hypothetical protein [Mycolicibacterium neoaurum]|uniref:hypothetical protein n=1 Tax=Mycolicibacterium neoaurum TaxID=1795 RepID=UPI001F4D02F0|nr:hypothetical protein [Mycolicibacterium neoaurum]